MYRIPNVVDFANHIFSDTLDSYAASLRHKERSDLTGETATDLLAMKLFVIKKEGARKDTQCVGWEESD